MWVTLRTLNRYSYYMFKAIKLWLKGMRFSRWCCQIFKSFVLWHCVIGCVVSVILKSHSVFIFRITNCDPSKHLELLTHQHSITSRKSWTFKITTALAPVDVFLPLKCVCCSASRLLWNKMLLHSVLLLLCSHCLLVHYTFREIFNEGWLRVHCMMINCSTINFISMTEVKNM